VAAFGADRVGATGVKYLNRLSDLLFVGARAVNQADDVPEIEWRP
jgi:cob(I)alamin adenosyltransferase